MNLFIYYVRQNQYVRASAITIVSGSIATAVLSIPPFAAPLTIFCMMALYGAASIVGYTRGKNPCKLHKIDSGKLIYVNAGRKRHPLLLWGVDAPEKEQAGHEATTAWLKDFIAGKNLTFTDVEAIKYFEGIQKPKFAENTSRLYANGLDVALEGLRTGHLFLTSDYRTEEMYVQAFGRAESLEKGIHRLHEVRPHIFRSKNLAATAVKNQRVFEAAGDAPTWIRPEER